MLTGFTQPKYKSRTGENLLKAILRNAKKLLS